MAALGGVLIQSSVAAATPVFKQVRAKEITSGTTNSLAFNGANVAGNLIVVYVVWGNTGTATVTDSRGNAYVAAAPAIAWGSTNSWRAQVFFAKNVVAGSNTVTATFSTNVSGAWGDLYIHEYSGIDRVSPLDVATSAKGTGTALNSGAATTTNANDLIFGGGASSGNTSSAGSGFTSRSSLSGNRTEDKVVSTAGSYNAAANQNNSQNRWVMQMVAFKNDGADTTAPSTPGNLTATTVSNTQINLGWNASTDTVGVTGYQVERCQGVGCSAFTLVGTAGSNSFNNTGLSPSTSYSYRVRATDAAGNLSGYSTVATATTPGVPDTTAPSVPTGLSGTGASIASVHLTWGASTDDVAVSGYKVFRNGVQVGTGNTPSFTDGGLTANTPYSYAVSAFDAAGNNSAQSSPAVAVSTLPDTTAPSVPAGLTAQAVSSTQVNLSWSASTDDVGTTGYRVYRDGTQVAAASGLTFQNTGLAAGTTYSYQVSAVDAAGNESVRSAAVPATTPALDSTPPSISMTAPGSGSTISGTVTVSASASDAGSGVHDVQFFVQGNPMSDDTTAPYSFQWDTTTTANGVYHLTAVAKDNAGNISNTSGTFTVTVSNPTGPTLPVGLEGGWNFNESTGATATDVTGDGNTATFNNGPLWTTGKYGSGLKFNGIDDYLSITDSST